MRTVQTKQITENIREMCIEANHFLTGDMTEALDRARESEKAPLGKQILQQLQENLQIAGEDMIPICQDTGMAVVFAEVGQGEEAATVGCLEWGQRGSPGTLPVLITS